MASFDILGSREKAVAIIESTNRNDEKSLADRIMKQHPSIKSVLRKLSERKGKFRKREYKWVKGQRNSEVIHKEHGFLLKLDPKKTYFSSREATERQRIAASVKIGERILVMFSGICPFAIAIEKKQPQIKEIDAIEINPDAHNYAEENIKLNNLKKIKAYNGDIKKILPKIKDKFDRIIMPLPKGAYLYLDLAYKKIKKNGVIHFYYWAHEEDLFSEAIGIAKKEAKKLNKKIKIINKQKVLPYGPRIWKIVLDIFVL